MQQVLAETRGEKNLAEMPIRRRSELIKKLSSEIPPVDKADPSEDALVHSISLRATRNDFNVMKSLTLLSKYLGCIDEWQELRKRYT